MAAHGVQIIDLSRKLSRYTNRWVALSSDERRVVASGKHPKEALEKAKAQGEPNPVMMWVPKEQSAYIV